MDEIRTIIHSGFSPIKCDITVYENGVPCTSYAEMVRTLAPDASSHELENIWRKTALEQTRGGWALCPRCYALTRSYLQT